MGKYNFGFFQIPQTGIDASGIGVGNQMSRVSSERMSNFGALKFGARNVGDYTQTVFGANAVVQNPTIPYFLPTGNFGNVGNAINNPYVWGSTTKLARNDEFQVMTLGSRNPQGVAQPKYDTMDTNFVWQTTFSGVTLKFPTEGYTTFGGRTGGPFNYVVNS